jgi:hypothetical protein
LDLLAEYEAYLAGVQQVRQQFKRGRKAGYRRALRQTFPELPASTLEAMTQGTPSLPASDAALIALDAMHDELGRDSLRRHLMAARRQRLEIQEKLAVLGAI